MIILPSPSNLLVHQSFFWNFFPAFSAELQRNLILGKALQNYLLRKKNKLFCVSRPFDQSFAHHHSSCSWPIVVYHTIRFYKEKWQILLNSSEMGAVTYS